ncbi:spermidine synthase [Stutzerimonas tarimensis]|uniref:Spermidine synthase n=1 Tax=Stutzerimonas tarimensis TaxID=1507735 RepID=A0ABV7T9G7_9GAMM
MEQQEQLLAEVQDAFGTIKVVQAGPYRFLEFGDAIEQSCVFMPDPTWLEYDYTRAMLLGALLHEAPQSALFLGLGGGSLTQACLRFLPLVDVEVIELRPDVPRLAESLLGFQSDPRITLRIGDALALLPAAEPADLIFIDLYTDTGPSAGHLAWSFLEQCQRKLNPGGWLIINQWGTEGGQPLGAALLRGLFLRHYLECPLAEGNVVLMVPADLDQWVDFERLAVRIEALAPRLGYSLAKLAQALRRAT